jgi:hypothetical protein
MGGIHEFSNKNSTELKMYQLVWTEIFTKTNKTS